MLAALSPTDCFRMAFEAARIAIEHMTPVILLTDAFIANGSSAWRVPDDEDYPEIKPNYVPEELKDSWTPYMRNADGVRYWAIPGTEGLQHRVGGLEKDYYTGVLSNDPENHEKMVEARRDKVANVAKYIPQLEVKGDEDADTIIVGWGGTYGHIFTAVEQLIADGKKIAFAQFRYINPMPSNTVSLLSRYKTVIVAELNEGQFAGYLQAQIPSLNIKRINKVQGQPFMVREIVDGVNKIMEEK